MNDHNFGWRRVGGLIGIPSNDPRIRELLSNVGLDPHSLWRELRVGIYTMPPYDAQPSPLAEIDLIPTYHLRLRFKHARLVEGARGVSPDEFVFSAVTYFFESSVPEERFAGDLPYNIQAADDPAQVIARVGVPPSIQDWNDGNETGYLQWADRNPNLHLLFNIPERRILRVNVFLAPTRTGPAI